LTELDVHEQSVARQAMRSGMPVPERILNAPELQAGLQLFLQAFLDLDGERMQPLSLIPWLSMKQYAQAYDLDEGQTEDLFYFVKKLDVAHIKRIQAKTPKAPKLTKVR
jgi:hypothetical protein